MNTVMLAVAGSRKTQSIIDACVTGEEGRKRLVITYTQGGQEDLLRRLGKGCSANSRPEVLGWYSFVMRHIIRPYLPRQYAGKRLTGLNFDGVPARGKYATGRSRYLDPQGKAYKLHLSKLAIDVLEASAGSVIDRLERLYDEVFIDETQDLTGYDLDIVSALLRSTIKITLVGDLRQSVYDTNPQDSRHKKYRGLAMIDWFEAEVKVGVLSIAHSVETWRSNQAIAAFSDSIFPSGFGFPATNSQQRVSTGHDGLFALRPADVAAYIAKFAPQCLRYNRTMFSELDLQFRNYGEVKGLTFRRVLIFPTSPIVKFLNEGTRLPDKSACGLYVAVTRAEHSVAFVLDDPDAAGLNVWARDPEA
jgi:DNA helicase-2/ATP-dependent DNA helicase PcrA